MDSLKEIKVNAELAENQIKEILINLERKIGHKIASGQIQIGNDANYYVNLNLDLFDTFKNRPMPNIPAVSKKVKDSILKPVK